MEPRILLRRELSPSDDEIRGLFADIQSVLKGAIAETLHFAVDLVAREGLQNAIEYGCRGDPKRRLRFSMSIDDEGGGFDPDAVLEAELAREPGSSGNGLRIISIYADRFRYENGGRTLIAEFVLGEARIMQDLNDRAVWAPRSDIVAANALSAKDELKALVSSSAGEFVVDLSAVRMIDSRGLGILIAAVNSLEAASRTMRIVGANEDLVGLLKMMRLDRHVKLG